VLIFIAACSSVSKKQYVPSYAEALELNKIETEKKDPRVISYLNERIKYENEIALYESKRCYLIPGGGVTLISRVNKKGVIDLVLAETENLKTKCYRETYLGKKFKSPEVYPLYFKMQMDYGNNIKSKNP
jgi:hypothetical protein